MFDYCPPLFVEHFQGQKAELIGYALGFWPSPTELGRNWHSATNHSPTHLEWDLRKVLNPQGGTYLVLFFVCSNIYCIPITRLVFLCWQGIVCGGLLD